MRQIIILISFSAILGLLLLPMTSCTVNKGDTVGFDKSMMDTTVKPQEDFYQYAVGNWIKNNPIPDDQTRWGAFNILIEETNEQVNLNP